MAEIAALGAAICWAVAGLFSVAPIKALGPIGYSRTRMLFAVITLIIYLVLTGQLSLLSSISLDNLLILILSGVVGIWFGDLMIYITVDRLGPRRTSVLFALNAPMQVLLGMIFLGETMSFIEFVGCVFVMTGAYCAIVFGKRVSQVHKWEDIKGSLFAGVLFGLGSALGQALGAFIVKPVMETGIAPEVATLIRCFSALVLFYICFVLPIPNQSMKTKPNVLIISQVVISEFLGMLIGMSLLLYAMANGDLGRVAIFSALAPVLMLPLIWITTKERPALGAWVGSCLAVLGIILLSTDKFI